MTTSETVSYKLQNVLLEDNQRTRSYESMYVRTFTPVLFRDDGTIFMPKNSRYEFSTYFGSLSIAKWKRYTKAEKFFLNIDIDGEFELRLTAYKNDTEYNIAARHTLSTETVTGTAGSPCMFAYPGECADEYDVVAFEITTLTDCSFKGAWYSTEVAPDDIADVELNIVTPTYKKEDFVLANVKLFEQLMESDEAIAGHLSVSIVDNGQTLGEGPLSDNPDIRLFPNMNAGGAGGFARGMLEALKFDRKPTHLLMMDDDVSVSPESFARTYNLLSIVNDEYADAFLSGAMISMQLQDHQVEDVGNIFPNATFGAIKNEWCLSDLNHIVANESTRFNRTRQYAAFWYCCFPMKTVEEQGLTMPFFVRGDDAEFGLRSGDRKFMTMNGICVWHLSFGSSKFNVFNECYLAIRNLLVIKSIVPACSDVDVYGQLFRHNIETELRKFNYDYCDLMCDAVEDWLRGPEWLAAKDPAKLLAEKSSKKPKIVEFDELPSQASRLFDDGDLSIQQKAKMKLTHNGHVHCKDSDMTDEPGVIYNGYGTYFPSRMYMHKELWHVNTDLATGFKTRIDRTRYREITARIAELDRRFSEEAAACEQRWHDAYPYLVSAEFWEEFLGIGGE